MEALKVRENEIIVTRAPTLSERERNEVQRLPYCVRIRLYADAVNKRIPTGLLPAEHEALRRFWELFYDV